MKRAIFALAFVVLISSCSGQDHAVLDYKETKSLVIDILKTEEARSTIEKAVKEGQLKASSEDKLAQLLTSPEGQHIQIAVKDILTSPDYTKQLEKLMTDPRFAGEFAKAVQEENKHIHKQLLKDPEYQDLLFDVFKSAEYEKMMIDILKGKEYRKQTMSILSESLENPIFKLELIQLLKKAMEENSNPDNKEENKSSEQADQESKENQGK